MDPTSLEPIVEAMLARHPQGLSEQALLAGLRAHPGTGMPPERPTTHLDLFRAHFLLFHTLYRLRDRLRRTATGDLLIDPLCIRREPYRAGCPGLDEYDRLRAYYLDLEQLERTGAADVARLLEGFDAEWRRRAARAEAMDVLDLEEPFDEGRARRQYRRLAMRHHPDRGGDADRLRAINRAYEILVPRRGT